MSGDQSEHPGNQAPVGPEKPVSGAVGDDALAVLGVLSDGVVIQRAGGEITYCNVAAERILGLTRDQMAGRTSLDSRWKAIHEDGSPFSGETHPAMVALRTGEAVRGVVMGVHRPDGTPRWISINADPIPVSDGRPASVVATFVDITDRLRAEEHYAALFRKMLNGLALHEMICDESGKPMDYRFLAVNPALERMTGLTADQIVGRTVLEVIPGTEPHWIETYGKVALTGEPVHFESYAAELGKHFEVTAYRPAPNQFATIFADITERKDLAGALDEAATTSTARADELQALMDEVPAIVFIAHDPACKRMTISRAGERMLNLGAGANVSMSAPPEERPTTFRPVKDGRDVPPEELPVQKAATGQPVKDAEITLEMNDGTIRVIVGDAVPLFDATGAVRGAVGAFHDVTEQRRIEEALRQSEAKFRLLAENSSDVIGILGADGLIGYVSPSCLNFTGYRQDELIGRPAAEIHFPDDRPVVASALTRLAAGAGTQRARYRVLRKDGSAIWVESTARAIRTPETGEISEFQFSVRDITDAKRTEDEVVRHRDHLEELVAERTASLLQTNAALEELVAANRRHERELRESEERLRLAQEASQSGTYEWDVRTSQVLWTPELEKLYGLPAGGLSG